MTKYSPYSRNGHAYRTFKDLNDMERSTRFAIKHQTGFNDEIIELAKRSDKVGIPTSISVGYWDSNPDYVLLNPEDDYNQINKAIDNAIKLNRLDENPPAIVAIIPKMGSKIPKWYYIKTDLPNYRKKISSKTKSKRKVCKCKK